MKTEFLVQSLPLILFSASGDDTRPGLSGVNFLSNGELLIVSTDGFRLSLIKTKKDIRFPSMLIPSDFLRELMQNVKETKDIYFSYSQKEKTVCFKVEGNEFFSRLIDEDFPPFERVIPQEKKTTIKLDKEEFLRNIKIISVFARELSNVVILETDERGVVVHAKNPEEGDNKTSLEAVVEGEKKQRVAFNFKFLLEFLSNVNGKSVTIEVLRPDAPVVFKTETNPDFLHIIMPVRVQE
jgi:DNA polymerase-3 subunit beta